MQRATVNDVESLSYRIIEVLLLLPTAAWGLFGLGAIFLGITGGVGGLQGPAGMVGILGTFGLGYVALLVLAVVSWLVTPVVLYLDTSRIAETDVDWDPNPILWAVGGFFLGHLMKLNHLYYRHKVVVDWVDRDWWWVFVTVGAVCPLTFLALGVALAETLGTAVTIVLVGLGILSAVPFALAIYRDATYVRLNSAEWRPNPGTYVSLGLIFLLLAPVAYPLVGGYYLVRRYGAVGFE
ncbi:MULTISPECIES: hypothetical protein [Haloarcula]|uniref:Uncharacterized protein n=1 Tax=Haloarcula pellucida TaxID=1427151 RepID=A0A830GQP9_9EURY|nr:MULTISPECIES: hypothetical protein [Halomicroarcula]MBX0348085.1 hypothetical protein [Halomicroarcula pellucida]MDS0277930.1 hypothetical protein [Halomicroarcula sp. S1AR25-4]GGN96857.1 hypothetical protein GCM10009030_25580 [Halomicroarcula pellucida]